MELLQTIFYILGIIFMVGCIVILIAIASALFYLKHKIDEIHNDVMDKINSVKQVTSEPAALARGAGSVAATVASLMLRRIFHR